MLQADARTVQPEEMSGRIDGIFILCMAFQIAKMNSLWPEKRYNPPVGNTLKGDKIMSFEENLNISIIIGVIIILILLCILLIFIGMIPLEWKNADKVEDKRIATAINQNEQRAMVNINSSGSINPTDHNISATPDPILSRIKQPFLTEEEQEGK
jgi:hypothetical protein